MLQNLDSARPFTSCVVVQSTLKILTRACSVILASFKAVAWTIVYLFREYNECEKPRTIGKCQPPQVGGGGDGTFPRFPEAEDAKRLLGLYFYLETYQHNFTEMKSSMKPSIFTRATLCWRG